MPLSNTVTTSTPLSDDVFYHVISCLQTRDLLRIALCSRLFARLAQGELFRDIHIQWVGHKDTPNRTFELLFRTFEERPKLQDLVRHVTVTVTSSWSQIDQYQNMLLSFPNVQSVTWPTPGLQADFLTTLLTKRPYLRRLQLTAWNGNLSISEVLDRVADKLLSLHTLEMEGGIALDEFRLLIRSMPSLEKLTCMTPGTHGPWKNPAMVHPLSPRDIVDALRPLENVLGELRMNGWNQHWPIHDGSRLDLSLFKKLKKVDVCSFLLFDSPGPGMRRNGVHALLPSSIQSLRVGFNWGSGVLYNSNEECSQFEKGLMSASAYQWLTELWQHKYAKLSGLSRILLWEPSKLKCGPPFDTMDWFPSDYTETFLQHRIELKCCIRKGYVSYQIPAASISGTRNRVRIHRPWPASMGTPSW